jgi:hypothetical protein
MVCGVVTGLAGSDACSDETVGVTEYMVMGAPVLVKVRYAVAPVFASTVMLRGLGLITSVCASRARHPKAASKNTTILGME